MAGRNYEGGMAGMLTAFYRAAYPICTIRTAPVGDRRQRNPPRRSGAEMGTARTLSIHAHVRSSARSRQYRKLWQSHSDAQADPQL